MKEIQVIESVVNKLIEQVPALITLTWIVWQFLKTMARRDEKFLENQRKFNQELRIITTTIHDLGKSIVSGQATTCNFHDSFGQQLDRIEQKIRK